MLRALSLSGLGGLFLMISPKLRGQCQEAIGSVFTSVQFYAPFSYIAGVLLVLCTLVYSFNRGSRAR
jgi:hypothetical protein